MMKTILILESLTMSERDHHRMPKIWLHKEAEGWVFPFWPLIELTPQWETTIAKC